MSMLQPYYRKFFFFFNDVQEGISADLVFIRKALQIFDCQVYIKGTKILTMGQKVMNVFFCYTNGARVADPLLGINITDLCEGSFFGDYQILLGIDSTFDYEATPDIKRSVSDSKDNIDTTWCLTIPAAYFINLCNEFPEFRSYLTSRGKKRRSFLLFTKR